MVTGVQPSSATQFFSSFSLQLEVISRLANPAPVFSYPALCCQHQAFCPLHSVFQDLTCYQVQKACSSVKKIFYSFFSVFFSTHHRVILVLPAFHSLKLIIKNVLIIGNRGNSNHNCHFYICYSKIRKRRLSLWMPARIAPQQAVCPAT